MARGKHLFPFRTEQLSPSAPMVLGPQGPGREVRRRCLVCCGPPREGEAPRRCGAVFLLGCSEMCKDAAFSRRQGCMRAIRHATPERSSNPPDSAGADPAMKAGGLRTRGSAVSSLALQHRLLVDRNPQPMMVYDLDTLRLVAVSDAAVATYGYSRSEFLNLTLFDIAPPEDRALVEEILPR